MHSEDLRMGVLFSWLISKSNQYIMLPRIIYQAIYAISKQGVSAPLHSL
jgi:hypothetical protein